MPKTIPEVSLVALRDVMESERFAEVESPLRLCLGQDVSGNPVATDLARMPHLLIAGATGSGKSVCVNALITSFLNTLAEVVKRGQTRGEIRTDLEPERIATMFLGLFQPSAFLLNTFQVMSTCFTTSKVPPLKW